MLVAIVLRSGFGDWARTNGLEIVMYITGAVLLGRLGRWIGNRITARIDARSIGGDVLVRSEEAKHRHAVIQVITWVCIVLVDFVAGVLVVQRLQIPLTSLVAPATVAGVAVGFGAQRLVQDLLAGFFAITERQYGFGDVIRISALGSTTGVQGTVEALTLRTTRMRTVNGEVVIIPNGQITQVMNLSRDWARAVIDVPVPLAQDIGHVSNVLHRVGQEAFADAELRSLLLDEPTVMGVEAIDVDNLTLRVVARTLPGKQFQVSRELRARIALAFREEGITVDLGAATAQAAVNEGQS